jgi:hypothetical protein
MLFAFSKLSSDTSFPSDKEQQFKTLRVIISAQGYSASFVYERKTRPWNDGILEFWNAGFDGLRSKF